MLPKEALGAEKMSQLSAEHALAFWAIPSKSPFASMSFGATQVPPTHWTLGRDSQSIAVSMVMPPVGQNVASARGEASALRCPGPPAEFAGKNFMAVMPFASRNIISDAVAAPGKKTTPLSLADLSNSG